MSKLPDRILSDWVESFVEFTSVIISPEIFRRWAAYSTIAGALERRVWTSIAGQVLYPNTIVLLVSPPGIGKSNAIKEVQYFWVKVGVFNVAPNGMTKAAFIDQLLDKVRSFSYKGFEFMTHPLLMGITEFGTLLPQYDREFLNVLNQIYDCEEIPFADRTRKGGLVTVDRAHLSMIAGTQPSYLGDILPDAAYGMGFTARTIMVYAGEKPKSKLFGATAVKDKELDKKLQEDMRSISKLVGPFKWSDEAKEFLEEWNEDDDKDAPTHPRLINYNPRRIIHTSKIAMSVAASRNNNMLVSLDDLQTAKALLIQAEELMPEIFKEMIVSQDASEIEEIHRFMFSFCRSENTEAVPEHKLLQYLAQKVPVNKIDYFMKTLQNSGMIKSEGMNLPGQRVFRPMPKTIFTRKPGV